MRDYKVWVHALAIAVVLVAGCAQAAQSTLPPTEAYKVTEITNEDGGWYEMRVNDVPCIVRYSRNGWGGAYAIDCDWSAR